MGSENSEFISSRHVMLDETSMVKPIVSQQVEMVKIKLVLSQRVKSDIWTHILHNCYCIPTFIL